MTSPFEHDPSAREAHAVGSTRAQESPQETDPPEAEEETLSGGHREPAQPAYEYPNRPQARLGYAAWKAEQRQKVRSHRYLRMPAWEIVETVEMLLDRGKTLSEMAEVLGAHPTNIERIYEKACLQLRRDPLPFATKRLRAPIRKVQSSGVTIPHTFLKLLCEGPLPSHVRWEIMIVKGVRSLVVTPASPPIPHTRPSQNRETGAGRGED